MTDVYTYSKNRLEIGKPSNFTDSKNILKIGIIPDEDNSKINIESDKIHTKKNPN